MSDLDDVYSKLDDIEKAIKKKGSSLTWWWVWIWGFNYRLRLDSRRMAQQHAIRDTGYGVARQSDYPLLSTSRDSQFPDFARSGTKVAATRGLGTDNPSRWKNPSAYRLAEDRGPQ